MSFDVGKVIKFLRSGRLKGVPAVLIGLYCFYHFIAEVIKEPKLEACVILFISLIFMTIGLWSLFPFWIKRKIRMSPWNFKLAWGITLIIVFSIAATVLYSHHNITPNKSLVIGEMLPDYNVQYCYEDITYTTNLLTKVSTGTEYKEVYTAPVGTKFELLVDNFKPYDIQLVKELDMSYYIFLIILIGTALFGVILIFASIDHRNAYKLSPKENYYKSYAHFALFPAIVILLAFFVLAIYLGNYMVTLHCNSWKKEPIELLYHNAYLSPPRIRGGAGYLHSVCYRYEYQGKQYISTEYTPFNIQESYKTTPSHCYVNQSDPTIAYIKLEKTTFTILFIITSAISILAVVMSTICLKKHLKSQWSHYKR